MFKRNLKEGCGSMSAADSDCIATGRFLRRHVLSRLIFIFILLSLISQVSAQEAVLQLNVSRYVVLDEPRTNGNAGPGFSVPPRDWNSDNWNGEATTIRAYAILTNASGGIPGVAVTFTIRNPGGTAVATLSATTDSAGVASISYNLNNAYYYGGWSIEASATVAGQTLSVSQNFIYNWWGCANCHKTENLGKIGTFSQKSPYTMGYDFHRNPQNDQHQSAMQKGQCVVCHQSYDNSWHSGSNPPSPEYPGGIHNNKQRCQDCHVNANTGNKRAEIAGCYDTAGCHPQQNSKLTQITTTTGYNVGGNYRSIYSLDTTTGLPRKAHTPSETVPCINCHNPAHMLSKPVVNGTTNSFTEDEQCLTCHVGRGKHSTYSPVYCTACHSQDAHKIGILDKTAGTQPSYTQLGSAGAITKNDCVDCHSSGSISNFFNTLTTYDSAAYNRSYQPQIDRFGYAIAPHNQSVPCLLCHDNTNFHSITFLNSSADYTTNRSRAVACEDCHVPGVNDIVKNFVQSKGYSPPQVDEKHNKAVPCDVCHSPSPHGGARFLAKNLSGYTTNRSASVFCQDCHVNPSAAGRSFVTRSGNYTLNPPQVEAKHNNAVPCEVCHSKNIHGGAWFLNQSLSGYTENRSQGVECTDCHTNTNAAGKVFATRSGSYTLNPPFIGTYALQHGNASWEGQNWGNYWNKSNDNSACLFCHDSKSKPKALHAGSAMGNVSGVADGALDMTGNWCANCHVSGSFNPSYNGTAYSPAPPLTDVQTAAINSAGRSWFNHTYLVSSNYTDSACYTCHAKESETPGNNLTLFVHNVEESNGGPDCVKCHAAGAPAPKHVDINAFKQGIHANLNSNVTNTSSLTDPIDKACWACHGDGTEPQEHPPLYKTPKLCTDCHLAGGASAGAYGAPIVSEHYLNGTDIVATTGAGTALESCLNCHQNPGIPEMRLSNVNDPDNGSFDADGDGVYGGNLSAYHYGTIPSNINASGYVSCTYCHQQNSSFDVVMQDITHNSMFNHTDNAGGPVCGDCHGSGKIGSGGLHSASLTKPVLTATNNTLCMSCHTDKKPHNSAGNRAKNETVYCVECHTGDINNVNVRDIHGIKYLNTSGKFEVWNTTSPAVCTTCHRSNPGGKFINASRIPPLNHSDSPVAGHKWNKTSQTYWTSGDEQSACAYCHGDSRHRANALGNVSLIEDSLTRNTTSLSSTSWCAGCHFNQAANYNGTAYSPMVVNISGWGLNNATDGTGYRDHINRGYISVTSYSDEQCFKCHGGLLSTSTPTTREFVHRVAIGVGGGNNCISCHDIGASLAPDIDFNATQDTSAAHRNLNSNVVTSLPAENKKCWACHTTNGQEPPAGDHPQGYNTPKLCEDCHTTGLFGAPLVKEHFKNGEDVKVTNADCWNCHSLGENQVSNLDFEKPSHYTSVDNNKSYASHYVKVRSDLQARKDESYCGYCHQQQKGGTTSSAYNQFFTDLNRTVQPDHSARSRRYYAPCFKCHNSINNLHAQSLKIPSFSSFDSKECGGCHITITSGNSHYSGMACKLCHVGTSNKVHNVTYLTESGTYVPAKIAKQQNSYAKCYTCHVNSTLDALMSSYGYTNVVKVPWSGHGDGRSADNSTTYWSDGYTACIFCHTTEHYEDLPIGIPVRLAGLNSRDLLSGINATISSGSTTWCGSCHIPTDRDYPLTVGLFFRGKLHKEPPVMPNTASHQGLGSEPTDDKCAVCHYAGSTSDGMDAFIHGIQ